VDADNFGHMFEQLVAAALDAHGADGVGAWSGVANAADARRLSAVADVLEARLAADGSAERDQWCLDNWDAVTARHGKVVRFPGLGHDVFIASDCGRQIVTNFLSRPDSYDTRCADAMQPPTFVS
jgi:hypothetical protein